MKFTGISRKISPLNSHGGTHLGEGHDVNQRMQMDPKNKKRVNEMSQQVKDSLQRQAWLFGKPFFSPKYQVNVDPEDGVLTGRPIYSDGSMLTYESLESPLNTGENHLWNGPLKRVAKTTKGKGRNFRSTEEGAGMTKKGVKEYKKENPGSNLQTAVTEKNPTGKRAARRKSFCARSRGWDGERGRAARRRWNC
tara:strand:+ start:868 stop:1449 length:582 start_codon:yes stop_codon:yes gene_type:complete